MDEQFRVFSHPIAPNSVVLEITPKSDTWVSPYLRVPVTLLNQWRPFIAIGASDKPLATDLPYWPGHEVDGATETARLAPGRDVPVGCSLYVRCAVAPEGFCFGSLTGVRQYRLQAGQIREGIIPVAEWIAQWMPPPVAELVAELHPDAASVFDARAQALLSKLSPDPIPRKQSNGSTDDIYAPRVYDVTVVREELPALDERGYISISDEDGCLSLRGEHYVELIRLSERIQGAPALRNVASVSFVKNFVFEWLVNSHRGVPQGESMCAALCAALNAKPDAFEVWVPLHRVRVERGLAFPLGHVVCRSMTPDFFDNTETQLTEKGDSDDQKRAAKDYVARLRTKHQGFAALVAVVRGETKRAQELARQRAEESASLLGLYDSSSFDPQALSASTLHDSLHEPEATAFVVRSNRIAKVNRGQVNSEFNVTIVRRTDLQDFLKIGLHEWNQVLLKSDRSKFETVAFNSMTLLTRGAVKRDLSDRLITTFAALEMVLLKDANESLQQNIGDRLALSVEETVQKRLEAVNILRAAYRVRSQFVHHGVSVTDHELMGRFLRLVAKFYWGVLPKALPRCATKADFVEEIDRLKYGADRDGLWRSKASASEEG